MYIPVCKVKNYIHLDDLDFHPDNSELRNISRERLEELKDSILNKGLYEPLLVWNKDNIVLSGNQRLRAMKELVDDGWTFGTKRKPNQIPVVVEDVTPEKANDILFSSNNHHGTWVEETLSRALEEAEDVSGYGFSVDEVNKYLAYSERDVEKEVEKASRDLDDSYKLDPDLTRKERKDDEETLDHLTLPTATMKELKAVLGEVAKALNPSWTNRDSLQWATQALCQAVRQTDLLEHIKEARDA